MENREKELNKHPFAEACIENSIEELEAAMKQPADSYNMSDWEIDAEEYFYCIQLALDVKKYWESEGI